MLRLSLISIVLTVATPAGAAFIPDDPYFATSWHATTIGLPNAWSISRGSSSVTVAIIDSGVMASTPDLAGRLLPPLGTPGQSVSDGSANHHGTWVASVLGMGVNNGIGGVGVGECCGNHQNPCGKTRCPDAIPGSAAGFRR